MAEKTAQDKMMERFRVKVVKAAPDDRLSLCGEKLKVADGEHFFIIPGHQSDYINKTFPHYRVSEPFIPGVDIDAALSFQNKPVAEETEGDDPKK